MNGQTTMQRYLVAIADSVSTVVDVEVVVAVQLQLLETQHEALQNRLRLMTIKSK